MDNQLCCVVKNKLLVHGTQAMSYDKYLYLLFQLMDTKTADKKLTLMHFLVDTVTGKFPEIINFDSELRFIEKAALGRVFFDNHKYFENFLIKIVDYQEIVIHHILPQCHSSLTPTVLSNQVRLRWLCLYAGFPGKSG